MPYARVRQPSAAGVVVATALAVTAFAAVGPANAATVVREYGSGTQLAADAGGEAATTTLDVPPGRRAVRLSTFVAPRGAGTGSLDVLSGSRIVGRIPARHGRVSLRLPAQPEGDVALGQRYRTAGSCGPIRQQVSLSDTRLTLTGTTRRPTSVASFFDPAVSRVTVVVPDGADDAVAAAALATVGAMAHRYGVETRVTLLPASVARASRTLDDGLASRIVRIVPAPGGRAVVRIASGGRVPTLVLQGPAKGLAQAGAALGDDRLGLADGPAVDDVTAAKLVAPALRRSLASLGRDTISLGGTRASEAQVTVRQSDFGGPVSGLRLQLSGTHTAVAPGTSSVVDVLWDDRLVDSVLLTGGDPSFRRAITIPSRRLEPTGNLVVRMRSATANGRCATALPVELDVDGRASVITATRGESVRSGFRRFPQALGAALPVVLGDGVGRDAVLRSAGSLVAALQRQAGDQLAVSVTSLEDFRERGLSGLVVGATLRDSTDLDSPFRLTRFRTIREDAVAFGVGGDQPYAALVAFAEGGRDVLMLGGWAPSDATRGDVEDLEVSLADRTGATGAGWRALDRDVAVLSDATRPPVVVVKDDVVPQSERTDEYRGQLVWPFVVVALVVLAGIAQVLLARRRRRIVEEHVAAQEQADESARADSRRIDRP